MPEDIEAENNIKIAALAEKYCSDPISAPEEEILQNIISKDKYLFLAHYLLMNRNDDSKGYHYAKIGLGGFTNTSYMDGEIIKVILEVISRDGCDGMRFQYSHPNYSALFLMSEVGLFADYESLVRICPDLR